MNVTLRGSLIAYRQSQTWDFDPARGYIYRAHFRGASQALMLLQQQAYVNAGIACRLIYNQGDSATLEVEDPTQQYTIDTWQFLGNEESRDGLSHPKLELALLAASLNAEKLIVAARKHLEANDDPTDLFAVGGDFYSAPALFQQFYNLQLKGSTEYRRGQYVLRHTTNAPARWTTNIADYGVDKIYTPAQLLSEVANAGLWIYPLPYRMQYKISNLVPPAARTNYLWGWLKSVSTETTAANNRIEINTEYTLEQWALAYYDPY